MAKRVGQHKRKIQRQHQFTFRAPVDIAKKLYDETLDTGNSISKIISSRLEERYFGKEEETKD